MAWRFPQLLSFVGLELDEVVSIRVEAGLSLRSAKFSSGHYKHCRFFGVCD
jgi:hypothetical protein